MWSFNCHYLSESRLVIPVVSVNELVLLFLCSYENENECEQVVNEEKGI